MSREYSDDSVVGSGFSRTAGDAHRFRTAWQVRLKADATYRLPSQAVLNAVPILSAAQGCLSAVSGSSRIARQAGTNDASTHTARMPDAPSAKTIGSVGLTP